MLKDFVKAAVPEEEEFKKELKEAQEKLNSYQMQIKEAKLPVISGASTRASSRSGR